MSELVRIDDDISSSSDKFTTSFVCTSSAYLFAQSLTFEIEYRNGTTTLVKGNHDFKPSKTPPKIRIIYELNHKAVLDVNLTPDISMIHCLAPFGNSTEIIRTTKYLDS